ncbi:hypothetical protein AB0H71_18630 [Nocardia sp. NPDC050697]|uniref:hypothetical protein n=1 Tax=Nocardia sp. NPDC050697 TaxID=3155158 RepID=UPI0033D7CF0B
MTAVNAAVGLLILIGVCTLLWQRGPQGPRGRLTPILALVLLATGYVLVVPVAVRLFDQIRINLAFPLSHLCSLGAMVPALLYTRCHLSATPLRRREMVVTAAAYASVGALLMYLFLTAPEQQAGAGFGFAAASPPRMQIYWLAQAVVLLHATGLMARVILRARARERGRRRALLSVLAAVTLVFAGYEVWVIVIATAWPSGPPLWAQCFAYTLQLVAGALLVMSVIGPAALGTYRDARLARFYLGRLTPLHAWLTERYPQVRFRAQPATRAETRVTDMLIEISDALRMLQSDDPALAADYRLDDRTIRAAAENGPHPAAYELTAAQLFGSAHPPDALATAPGHRPGADDRAGGPGSAETLR